MNLRPIDIFAIFLSGSTAIYMAKVEEYGIAWLNVFAMIFTIWVRMRSE